ncbi:hypothetical protein PM082_006286 [Marasmius tenuissimus]|nr:hypothetical protein PM082_006286 [Marasmius tenuissimus]
MKNPCSMPKALKFTEIGSEGFETRNTTYSDIVKREIEGFEPKGMYETLLHDRDVRSKIQLTCSPRTPALLHLGGSPCAYEPSRFPVIKHAQPRTGRTT